MATTDQTHTKQVVAAQVPAAVADELRKRADLGDRTVSAEIRRALTRYLAER